MKQKRSPNWGGKRDGSGRPFSANSPRRHVKVSDLQALVASFQALCNIAEVKASELLDDPQWLGIKSHLFEQAKALGVDVWVDVKAEEQRQRIEEEEE